MYVVFVRFISEYLIYILLSLTIYFVWKRNWKQLLVIIISLGLTVLIRKVTGILIFEPRPFVVNPNLLLYPTFKAGESSFFSGHAANSFAFAGSVFWYRKKLGIVLLIIAGIIASGRVLAGLHYIWDVGIGAMVGVLISYAIKNFSFIIIKKFKILPTIL